MILKTKFNKATSICLLSGLLVTSTMSFARAQSATSDPPLGKTVESSDAVWFRDGTRWIEARRVAGGSDGRQRIALRNEHRSWHAEVGTGAILQLPAAATPAAFFRANRVVARRALNPRLGIYLVESSRNEDGLAIAARLAMSTDLEAALPDLYLARHKAEFEVPPNDPRYRGQWYLKKVGLERVWQVTAGAPETTIVVVDDGCDMDHPDLAAAMLGGRDVLDEDDDASYTPRVRGNEHGTACAGIVAAVGNNDLGITGACPQCTLRCVRLFDRNHALIPLSADVEAFSYAFETGAAVVSNSWGFSEPGPVASVLRNAIVEVMERGRGGKGAVVVFAAGNESREIEDDELAAIPGLLNIGAVNSFDEAAPFSNFGRSVSITAPTGNLTTDIAGPDGADPTDYTSLFGGTSSAAPVVAGVAALLISALPERSGSEIVQLLIDHARKAPFAVPDAAGHDPLYGRGILNPVGALEAAGVTVPEAPEPKPEPEPEDAAAADGGEREREKAGDDGCSVKSIGGDPSWRAPIAAVVLVTLLRRRKRQAHQ